MVEFRCRAAGGWRVIQNRRVWCGGRKGWVVVGGGGRWWVVGGGDGDGDGDGAARAWLSDSRLLHSRE